MRRLMFVWLAIFLVATPASGQEARNPLDGFDTYVREAIRTWEVPGLAVAVVQGDSVLFSRGYGVRELGRADPEDQAALVFEAYANYLETVILTQK